jgi:mono/diheme cytochrome c family protein
VIRLMVLVSSAALGTGCSRSSTPAPGPDPQVHAIVLPDIAAPELPDAPGRAMFYGACSTCHTPRYVADQPPLPRSTWAAEVAKMRTVYGAPIPEEMTGPIVDYLAAVHGTGR